ncbi:5-(carboxyamino)imidazole ribonucleotide mutase [Fundicoccus culcitae]|uniref:N5-carboxyaminoimidazole ribonucleotide mutase n=1 Tax=Fundicoccus culcitae TaxID=2969821 RepID=A0ABY5P9J2_9LACT|nr:5-(carboxyamino)imidazole ribonucleotide mutase [Fundicoccus culcitae]UUX35023.1 5-(carboxyamino)imidazole ribonucleotide mutase [Fundicoccus culcitae]
MRQQADVAVIMGSISDWEQMRGASEILDELGITHDRQVISAHRMPNEMLNFAETARKEGYKVIIAGAGGAAHLPGMIASSTTLPVIGVPIKSSALSGQDSLLSIVQMPAGVPVATMAIGPAGAKNAALMAARILAVTQVEVELALTDFQERQHLAALESSDQLYD